MKKKLLAVAVGLTLVGSYVPSNAVALERELDARLVFEIGGKAKVKRRKNRVFPIGGGISWKTPMCGNFDMSLSVTNILNGVTGQLEKLGDDLIASVTGVVSNWAWMEIARADPQLYEMIQQGKLEASELFSASVATCEEMTDKMIKEGYGAGSSPSAWIETSGFEDWGASDEEDDDVVQVEEDINKSKGDSGVTWMGGDKKGGKSQAPIEVEKDAIKAGYNQLANRDVKSESDLPASEETPWYAQYWKNPEEAEDWISSVIGTTTIRTCIDCERLKTTPGKGVYAKLEEEQRRIELKLLELLELPIINYETEQLEEISAPGYGVTQQVMEALKGEGIYRKSLVERLSEEIAVAGIVERLIAARRIMLSGLREANIAQNADAVDILNSRISEIAQEMELLRQDAELRATTKASVAVTILERKRGRENYNSTTPQEGVNKALRNMTGRGH